MNKYLQIQVYFTNHLFKINKDPNFCLFLLFMLIRYLLLATLFYLNNFIEYRILISSNFDLFGMSHNQIKKKKKKWGGWRRIILQKEGP